jgi:hypothetical protein
VALRPVDRPIRFQAEYREEDHTSVSVRDPWTIRDRDRNWRPLAAMAEGPLRTLALEAALDTRDDLREAGHGVVGPDPDPTCGGRRPPLSRRFSWKGSQPGVLTVSSSPQGSSPWPWTAPWTCAATTGWAPTPVSISGFWPLGPWTGIHFRPSTRWRWEGEGSLPGHSSLRAGLWRPGLPPSFREGEEVHPFYGCDRVLLGQVEYHGLLPFSLAPGRISREEDWEWGALLELQPAWTFFLNGGRKGWAHGGGAGAAARRRTVRSAPMWAPVVHLGALGLYWAYPLNRRDRGLNFFVRLQHRF